MRHLCKIRIFCKNGGVHDAVVRLSREVPPELRHEGPMGNGLRPPCCKIPANIADMVERILRSGGLREAKQRGTVFVPL